MRWTLPLTARYDWATLLAALAFGGAVSTVLGPHHGWDLKNYHLYNAHAFLTGRIGTDIAPAMIQTYHNPLIELPFYYLLLHFNEHPYLITFAMGLPYGVMVFLVFWLSREVFADPASPPGGADLVRVLGATAIGATGAATVSVVGTTNNDIYVAILVLAGLCPLVRRLRRGGEGPLPYVASGLLVGAAVGLKLTAASYGVGALAAVGALVVLGWARWTDLFAWAAASAAGFAATAGFWLARMYATYGNPLFPYYNGIFRSEHGAPVNHGDRRFGPKDALDYLTFPFDWARGVGTRTGEVDFRDVRIALALVLALAVLPMLVAAARATRPLVSRPLGFVMMFAALSYAVWLVQFGYYRFATAIEGVSGIVIVGLVSILVARPALHVAATSAAAILAVATTDPFLWDRTGLGDTYLEIAEVDLPPDATVVFTGHSPLAYVAVALPPSVRLAGIDNNFLRTDEENASVATIRSWFEAPPGPLYVVFDEGENGDAPLLRAVGWRRSEDCRRIETTMHESRPVICRVRPA